MNLFNDPKRSPAEKDTIRKGVLAAVITDSLLFGWIFARRNAGFDFKKRRLK